MRLLMVNSLIMFDVVFAFFLFLIAITCIVYYLPGGKRQQACDDVDSDVIPPPPLFEDEPADRRNSYIHMSPGRKERSRGPEHLV